MGPREAAPDPASCWGSMGKGLEAEGNRRYGRRRSLPCSQNTAYELSKAGLRSWDPVQGQWGAKQGDSSRLPDMRAP